MSEEKQALEAATQKILRELAEFLLANNFNHKSFAPLSKRAFVQAGKNVLEDQHEFSIAKLQDLTGLSRVEISRANEIKQVNSIHSEKIWARAMSGLHRWHTKSKYVDKKGNPKLLDLSDTATLCNIFGIEKEEGTRLLEELHDAKCIEQVSKNEWRPITRYYIPRKRMLKFHYFGQAVSRLISTLHRNINNSTVEPWVERVVTSTQIKPEARPLFAQVGKEQILRFMENMDDWVSANETETTDSDDPKRAWIGLGVYYFEE